MKISGMDHIGIAVSSINKAMDFYNQALGLELSGIENITDRDLKVGFINTDNIKIELIEPISEDSTIAKYIAKKGEGIHHICFKVENITKSLAKLKSGGFELIDKAPKDGAKGSKIAFMHPRSAGGVLIELKEVSKEEVS